MIFPICVGMGMFRGKGGKQSTCMSVIDSPLLYMLGEACFTQPSYLLRDPFTHGRILSPVLAKMPYGVSPSSTSV